MSENYIVINGKKAELTEEQLKKLGIQVSNNKRWRGNLDEKYYRVDTFNQVSSLEDINSDYDTWLYHSHNYFKTRGDAEKYARVLETEMLLRKYADKHNEDMPWDGRCGHYFFYYNVGSNVICTDCYTCSKEAREIYFSSKEIARAAIEEIGKERIEEYLTYEW